MSELTDVDPARAELAAAERRTRLILEAALDAVILIDHRGVITDWSGQAEAIFGWSAVEALGRTLSETIVPPASRTAHNSGLTRVAAGEGSRILGRRIEVTALHRSGREFPVELAITAIDTASGVSYSAFVRDITPRHRAEQRLKESEERFRALADGAPVLIWMMDAQQRCTWFNRQWLTFVGQPLEKELGFGWAEHVEPADFARCLPIAERAAAAREAFSFEYRLRRHDGQWRWILSQGAPRFDADGEFAGYLGSGVDITERIEAAHALASNESRFRTLAESLPQLVWTCRADGWCDYLSRQWLTYTGRSHEEQVGSGWAEQVHPDDRARVRAEWGRAVRSGRNFDCEFRIRRADGVYRWFKTRAVPLCDSDGQIVRWFGSNTDMDELKGAEGRLLTQLQRLTLLDRTTHAIGERQDLASIFQVVLQSLEAELSIDFGCIGVYEREKGLIEIRAVGPKSHALAQQLHLTVGTSLPVDANGLSKCTRGRLVHEPNLARESGAFASQLAAGGLADLVIAPLMAESRVFGMLIAARRSPESFASGDCEFLRQLCEHVGLAAHQAQLYGDLERAYRELRDTQTSLMQQERLRAFGQMASGLAHDINNALSPASLYLQSLLEREKGMSPQGREFLVHTQRAVEDVTHTVARMREFYRRSDTETTGAPLDLNELIGQVVNLTRARWSDMMQERGWVIELNTALEPRLPMILGVQAEIRDALTNLVLNAVDAMPNGGTLRLSSRLEGERVCVEVRDTGVGMDETARRRCIEPFFTTKGERGTGLGLAMVYGTAERHKGTLEIDSVLGKGTCARLRFPLAPRASLDVQPLASATLARALNVLLIDDDPMVLQAVRHILQADGHSVTGEMQPIKAIEHFATALESARPFDLVITDLGMPFLDGRKVALAIKARSPRTPVVLLTGWGHRLLDEQDRPEGIECVLAKPPKIEELRRALTHLARTM